MNAYHAEVHEHCLVGIKNLRQSYWLWSKNEHNHTEHYVTSSPDSCCQLRSSSSQSMRRVPSSPSRCTILALTYASLFRPQQQQERQSREDGSFWSSLSESSTRNSTSANSFLMAVGEWLAQGSFVASVVTNCLMWSSRASEIEFTMSFEVSFFLSEPWSLPSLVSEWREGKECNQANYG